MKPSSIHSVLPSSRRQFLAQSAKASAAVVTASSLVACATVTGANEPVVETTLGRVRGQKQRGAYAFRGIPYAASTAGANRFRAPVARTPWAGVRDAFTGGASAPQLKGASPVEFAWYWSSIPQDEDCLSLSVFTPALRDNKKRPILVWLHGGAFSAGAGTSDGFDGSYLAQSQDVVVVSINHRLNVLGSIFTGEHTNQLSAESANVGVLDQVAALQWVKANAEAFGGNADNVTIFGQSGGAAKVTALLGAPAARGLIQRAVVQSGSGLWKLASADNAARYTHRYLREFGLTSASAGRLRDVPVEQLIAAFGKVAGEQGGVSEFRPTLDGVVFTQEPYDPVGTQLAANIPVLIGNASQEATFFLAGDPRNFNLSQEQVFNRVKRFIKLNDAQTKQLIDTYRDVHRNATPSELLIAISGDYNYRLPTLATADRQAALNGAPVYAYEFDWKSPARGGVLSSPHTAEVPFIFGTLDAARPLIQNSPDQLQVRDRLGAIWGEFARSGRPDTKAVANWTPYTAAQRTTAFIGKEWVAKTDPAAHARAAFASVGLYEYSFPVSFVRD